MLLGSWHVGKVASEVVFRTYFADLLAPAWHALLPTGRVWRRPKYLSLQAFFISAGLSYPAWRPALQAALARADLTDSQRLILQNYADLFEELIPLVSHRCCCCC
jgi:hypothetical protein